MQSLVPAINLPSAVQALHETRFWLEKRNAQKYIATVRSMPGDACCLMLCCMCRFPATFTFVVRSFTVLDGIGKSLDPRFDMTEIAAPYARGLLLEAKPQIARLQKDLAARLGQQVRSPFSDTLPGLPCQFALSLPAIICNAKFVHQVVLASRTGDIFEVTIVNVKNFILWMLQLDSLWRHFHLYVEVYIIQKIAKLFLDDWKPSLTT